MKTESFENNIQSLLRSFIFHQGRKANFIHHQRMVKRDIKYDCNASANSTLKSYVSSHAANAVFIGIRFLAAYLYYHKTPFNSLMTVAKQLTAALTTIAKQKHGRLPCGSHSEARENKNTCWSRSLSLYN